MIKGYWWVYIKMFFEKLNYVIDFIFEEQVGKVKRNDRGKQIVVEL